VLGAIVLLLVAAQIFLPGIAAQKARERVARYGTVRSAHVKAFPAIELLWGQADSATVKAGSLHMTTTQAADLLASTRGIKNMDLSVETLAVKDQLTVKPLVVRDVNLQKRGGQFDAQAQLRAGDLRAALDGSLEVQPVASGGGDIEVQASGGLFGVQASVRALVGPQEGKLVAQPQGFPLAGLARLTLFSDPRVFVEGVGASVAGGSLSAAAASYQVRVRARLG
jgi:hypothetical protein